MEYILQVNNMNISFGDAHIIKNLSINLKKGEILSVVGASGSGKTLFAHGLMGILPDICTGEILFNDKPIKNEDFILIPQNSTYLDPLMKISKQISLVNNELNEKSKNLYPFQCSGGMIRNALFSLVYEKNASIIIADEPTPGLDLKTALETLEQLRVLANQGKSVILITHDIDLAINISDRVAVFFDGTILEIASKDDFYKNNLRHPYTKALFNALPQNEFKTYNFPSKINMNSCFCIDICEKSNEKCCNKIEFVEINDGLVRCNNVS